MASPHTPVLLDEVIHYLHPKTGESYLDLTAGYGGHAQAVLAVTNAPEAMVLVDRDQQAIDHLQTQFDESTRLIHQDYLGVTQQLCDEGMRFDMILADLGVSSVHLNNHERGFSFMHDAPLDMRMDQGQKLTAATIVNTYSVDDLAEMFKKYGEEPKARRIAQLITENRPVTTTTELARLIERVWPRGKSKHHPATRTFQALRIVVNDELGQLERSLQGWLELLNPGGRIAIISFHSLEDRIVKQFMKEHAGDRYDASLKLLTNKPVVASEAELAFNPRARSARLRAAAKINTKTPHTKVEGER